MCLCIFSDRVFLFYSLEYFAKISLVQRWRSLVGRVIKIFIFFCLFWMEIFCCIHFTWKYRRTRLISWICAYLQNLRSVNKKHKIFLTIKCGNVELLLSLLWSTFCTTRGKLEIKFFFMCSSHSKCIFQFYFHYLRKTTCNSQRQTFSICDCQVNSRLL